MLADKKSITGNINIISNNENNSALIEITYSKYNVYSHSIFGIEIPEFKSKHRSFKIKKKFNAQIMDNSLLISDTKTPMYYLFDLQIGQVKSPYIEVKFNNFIFSQIIGIILNLIIMDVIKLF